ncbi:MAG: DUF481 domain-containing protein, partial [Planctomycetales bacterium]
MKRVATLTVLVYLALLSITWGQQAGEPEAGERQTLPPLANEVVAGKTSPPWEAAAATDAPRLAAQSNGPDFSPEDQLNLSAEGQSPASQPGEREKLPPMETSPPGPSELAAEITGEEETVAWYSPKRWIGPVWAGSLEFGLNGSEGNAQSLSFRVGADLTRETETHVIKADVVYTQTNANSVTTQNNALSNLRFERLFADSPWSFFVASSGEYDEFKAFDYRISANSGLARTLIETDIASLRGKFGAGFSHEIGGPDDSYVPEAVFGLELERQINALQKFTAKADYFPDLGEFGEFRLVFDAGWEVILDEETNLSLKIGVIDRHDSTPNGRRANDFDYS